MSDTKKAKRTPFAEQWGRYRIEKEEGYYLKLYRGVASDPPTTPKTEAWLKDRLEELTRTLNNQSDEDRGEMGLDIPPKHKAEAEIRAIQYILKTHFQQ